jgi:hypothetical protein
MKQHMMKKLLLRFSVLIFTCSLGLQPYAVFCQIADYAHIRNSGDYYWGTGQGANFSEARRNALADLAGSIQVEVKHKFEAIVVEENGNLEEYVSSVVTTYSSAVLSFYETKVLSDEPGKWETLTYISKAKLRDHYNDLEQYIDDFIVYARRAEEDMRIADALKYYYWALLLTRSHPDNQKLRNTFGGDLEEPLYLGLNDRISNIFSYLNIEIVGVRHQENPQQTTFDLVFTYRGKRVQNLDYTYWVGDGYSAPYSAANGMGAAIFHGETGRNIRTLRILPEYQYRNKAQTELVINRMFENLDILPFFPRAELKLPVEDVQTVKLKNADKYSIGFEVLGAGLPEHDFCRDAIRQVILAIQSKNYMAAEQFFTYEGFGMYQKLISQGQASVLGTHMDTLRLVRVGDRLMARSVPMLFAYHNNREKFVENVVFTFDKDKKISSLSFALSDVAIGDIVNKPTGFGTLDEKYFLISFMEHYKTAFALKRLDYIESIFADEALIIVGHVVEKVRDVENPWLNHEVVRYNTYSKQQYLGNLAANFRRNEFVNIRFEDNIVRKTERDDKIYGIQIAQHYYSSTYADKGYLFLMIDLSDTLNPLIYVRTWQPEKNPDGSIFGLEHFRIN